MKFNSITLTVAVLCVALSGAQIIEMDAPRVFSNPEALHSPRHMEISIIPMHQPDFTPFNPFQLFSTPFPHILTNMTHSFMTEFQHTPDSEITIEVEKRPGMPTIIHKQIKNHLHHDLMHGFNLVDHTVPKKAILRGMKPFSGLRSGGDKQQKICMPYVEKYCDGQFDKSQPFRVFYDIYKCMSSHKANIAQECQTRLQDSIYEACQDSIDQFCDFKSPIRRCLHEHYDTISPTCKNYFEDKEPLFLQKHHIVNEAPLKNMLDHSMNLFKHLLPALNRIKNSKHSIFDQIKKEKQDPLAVNTPQAQEVEEPKPQEHEEEKKPEEQKKEQEPSQPVEVTAEPVATTTAAVTTSAVVTEKPAEAPKNLKIPLENTLFSINALIIFCVFGAMMLFVIMIYRYVRQDRKETQMKSYVDKMKAI